MASEAMRLNAADLMTNPTPRVPIALCLDASGSMGEIVANEGRDLGYSYQEDGQTYRAVAGGVSKMDELNAGVRQLFDALLADPVAAVSAEVAIVSFADHAQLLLDFQALDRVGTPPPLTADGNTDLGGGVELALRVLDARKAEYKSAGVDYFQPWLVLMTDGAPTTATHPAQAQRVTALEAAKKLTVFNIGIGDGADTTVLGLFSGKHPPYRLVGMNFREFFQFLSRSVAQVSQSRPGEKLQLDTNGIERFLTIDT